MGRDEAWSVPRRQSAVALLISFWGIIKNLWPVLLFLGAKVFLDSSDGNNLTKKLLSGLAGVMIVYLFIRIREITHYFFFRFCIVEDQLLVYSGIFTRKTTVLPLSRIQAIHTRQLWIHRLTNTCKLVIDTAGTEQEELEIIALDIATAAEFKAALQPLGTEERLPIASQDSIDQASPSEQGFQLGIRDIIKLSISENHLKTFLVILAFVIGKLQDIKEYLGIETYGWMRQQAGGVNATMQNIVFVFILGMLLAIVVSAFRVIIRFYGFTLRLSPKAMEMKWGLLETHQKQIPYKKIQMISWQSTFLRRLMHISLLRLHVTAEDETKADQLIQVPLTKQEQVLLLAGNYQPLLPAGHVPFINISKQYVIRQIVWIGFPVTLAAVIGLYFVLGFYSIIAVAWYLYFIITRFAYQRNFKIWISDKALQIEKGVWGRHHSLVNFDSIQQVSLKTTPYKRKHGLADVQVFTAGSALLLPYLPQAEAAYIMDFILANIEFSREIVADHFEVVAAGRDNGEEDTIAG